MLSIARFSKHDEHDTTGPGGWFYTWTLGEVQRELGEHVRCTNTNSKNKSSKYNTVPNRTDTNNAPLHAMCCEEFAHALHVSQGVRGARLMRPLQTKRLHANIWVNKRHAKMKIVHSKYHMFGQARGYV